MSRPLRSALTLAQTSIAGPSNFRSPRYVPTHQSQIRTAFNFNFKLPAIFSRSKDEEPTSAVTPTTSTSNSGEVVTKSETSGSLFDEVISEDQASKKTKKYKEHGYTTATHKASHRKLNLLARQIAGHPIDEAIVQMEFSEKRSAKRIKSTLALARDHAVNKGLDRARLIVAESWISKGPKVARIDIKGRGRIGIKHHPSARLHVLLKEGKTRAELDEGKFFKALGKVRSAGVVREDGVLRRKVVSGWSW